MAESSQGAVHIIDHRRYKPVWRKTLEEYADMQEWHLLKMLDLMRDYPQYKFTLSQAIILENFILRHFDLETEIKVRLQDGQLGIAGGCYTIPDTNVVSGEALYRNLIIGLDYLRRQYEYGTTVASLEGAYGCSAQLPQMLASLGLKHLAGSPTPGLRLEMPDGSPAPEGTRAFVWEGLDGTAIPVHLPTITAGPTRFYPEPFQETFRTKESFELLEDYRGLLREAQALPDGSVWLHIWDEERKIDEEIVDAVWEERRRKQPKQMVFSTPQDYINAIANEPVTAVHRGEMNPDCTGVFTTRITIKQASVRLENLLGEVEKWFSIAASEGTHFPALKFRDLWKDLFLLQSQQAIAGCHTDKVSHRLESLAHHVQRDLGELRTRGIHSICAHINAPRRDEWRPLHVFNSLNWRRTGIVELRKLGGVMIADNDDNPVPVLNRGDVCFFLAEAPPCGYNTYWYLAGGGQQPRESEQREFSTANFDVAVSDDGMVDIRDRRNGTAITREGAAWGAVQAREDRGDMWCKGYTGKRADSVCSGVQVFRELLGWEVKRTGRIDGAGWQGFGSATWSQSLYFYDSLSYFDMHLDVAWKGNATELRLMLPFGAFALSSVYGIPFGAAARMPYSADAVTKDGLSTVQGEEWPACRWVEFGDGDYGVTVAHSGTPGIKCDEGVMEVSLLRSPVDDPQYSHNFYLKAERGAHENGTRHYRFSFLPGAGDWRSNGSANFGYEHQNPLFAYVGPAREGRSELSNSFLDFGPRNLICTAWTVVERNRQLLRIVESVGKPTELVWGRKPQRGIYAATPFGERREPVDRITFKPFEIKHIMLS